MNKRNLYSFLTAFFLLIAVIVINWFSFTQMKDYAQLVDHTRVAITSFEKIANNIKSAEIYSPYYDKELNINFYKNYKLETANIIPEIQTLRRTISDNPIQAKRVDTLKLLVEAQLGTLKQKNVVEIINSGEIWRLEKLYEINTLINRGIETEASLLKDRKENLDKFTKYSSYLTGLFSISAFLLIAITFLFNLSLLKNRHWLEGFLESILNTSRNGIITCKAVREKNRIIDFEIQFANAAVENLLKLKPNEVISKRLSNLELYASVEKSGGFGRFEKVVETGEQQEFELLLNVDNQQEWFHVLVAKLEDGVTASFNNITQIKKYQEDLQENIKGLAESNRQLEQFAYVASHDLQEPLRKIMVFGSHITSLYKDKLDEKAMGLLGKMNQSAERMSRLIYDILNFSSLKKEATYTTTDLNLVLDAVLEDIELKVTQSNTIINRDKLPVIEAIPLQMNQLFHNLLSNALKFANGNQSPVIDIKCRSLSTEDLNGYKELNNLEEHVEITITDNGIGFNQQYAEQIFGMFKRLNDKSLYPGSGIGLALCKKVVVNHRGVIKASSSVGEGATFQIILPKKQATIQPVVLAAT